MRFCKIRCRPVIAQGEARIRRAVVDEQLQRNLRIGDDILATVSSTRRGTPRFPRKYTRHMATIDAGRYHKKPYPAENGSVRMQTMSSAQILSSLFYIYVYMRQEIKQWTNRKTYAKMDKKRGMHCETRSACRPPQGNACLLVLFGHVLSGVRTAGIPTPTFFVGFKRFLWRFHINLFMFLSGYVFRITGGATVKGSRLRFTASLPAPQRQPPRHRSCRRAASPSARRRSGFCCFPACGAWSLPLSAPMRRFP